MAIGLVVDYSAHIVHNFVAITADAKRMASSTASGGSNVESIISNIPVFKQSTAEQRLKLAAAMATVTYEPGECIIKQGDEGDAFFIIESGEAQVTIDVGSEVNRGLKRFTSQVGGHEIWEGE